MAAQLGHDVLDGDPTPFCGPGVWTKTHDARYVAAIHAAGGKAYLRPYLQGDDGGVSDAHAWAHDVWTSVVATGGHQPDAIVFRNEANADQQFARDYLTFRADLRAAGYRGLVVLGSFSTGTPDFPTAAQPRGGRYDWLREGLGGQKPDAYDFHEYWKLRPDASDDQTWRHTIALANGWIDGDVAIFVGEMGAGAPDGWRKVGIDPQAYAGQLVAYAQGCAPQVVVAFCFQVRDRSGVWDDFGIEGTPADGAIRASWAVPSPPPASPATDYAGATWAPSPNMNAGRQGSAVTAIVLHGTAGGGAVAWFQNPQSQVSAHYVVDTDGSITQCVREANTAWHAGATTPDSPYAAPPGVNPNRWTIGIEHTRDQQNASPITPAQLAASLALVADIRRRHGPLAIVTHDQIQVGRVCPGPGFPVAAFRAPQTPRKEGHMNPSPLFKFDQGPGTLDCWCECIRSFFLRYGYPLDLDTVFQAGKGKARPQGGEAATFAEVKRAISTLATQLGVTVQMADADDPNTVFQMLRDPNAANPWTVIAGVAEQVLQPGQNFGHFMILSGFAAGNEIAVVDPLDHYDGNVSGVYPADLLAKAMIANWEPAIDAEGVKIVG